MPTQPNLVTPENPTDPETPTEQAGSPGKALGAAFALAAATLLLSRNPVISFVLMGISLVGALWRVIQLSRLPKPRAPFRRKTAAPPRGPEVENLGARCKARVKGNDRVIDAIVDRLRQNLKLPHPTRALGTFLLAGPPGAGKAFLAECVAEALFSGVSPVILPMAEYRSAGDVVSLLGGANGRDGARIPGTLIAPVRESPARVIVLEGLEKAHAEVLRALERILQSLSWLDKETGGRVTFHQCVFVATYDLGEKKVEAVRVGFDETVTAWMGMRRDAIREATALSDSFLSCWDQIYFLDWLSPIHAADVACRLLARYWRDQGIELTYGSPENIQRLLQSDDRFHGPGHLDLFTRYLRAKSDPVIEEVKRRGVKRLQLDTDASGRMTVKIL